MALCGLTMGISGFANSFVAFALMRPLLGILSSIFNPLSFSILADYFPADRRATANSIIQSGNYIGWGLSSISIMAISAFGWRKTYGFLGAVALLVSALVLTVVKEPPKVEKKVVAPLLGSKFYSLAKAAEESDDDVQGGISEVLSNPVNLYVLIGAFFRNFGGACTTFFLPLFFLKNFPLFKVQYSFVNSVILSIFGLTSGICGGIIADKFEKHNLWTKSLICIIGSASALPLIGAATL